jgi:L-ascorbate metabolism protein UlaG (beta-lactamase superfamily)
VAPDDGTIEVRFVGHATTLLELGGVRILTDPFLRSRLGPLERHGPLPMSGDLEADVVVISHGHPDHFDVRSLEALPGNPVLVVPRGLGLRCRDAVPAAAVIEVDAGDTIAVGGLRVQAVPARHWISPGAPRAKPIGFVLDAGPRVYFAGDTGRFDSMPAVAGHVDLALLPIWTWGPHLGPGHLGPRSAAHVAADLAPAAVVPIHWGTLYPRHLHRVWRRPLLEPGDRFASIARVVAPDVDVRVLRPGESTSIERSAARDPHRP